MLSWRIFSKFHEIFGEGGEVLATSGPPSTAELEWEGYLDDEEKQFILFWDNPRMAIEMPNTRRFRHEDPYAEMDIDLDELFDLNDEEDMEEA